MRKAQEQHELTFTTAKDSASLTLNGKIANWNVHFQKVGKVSNEKPKQINNRLVLGFPCDQFFLLVILWRWGRTQPVLISSL